MCLRCASLSCVGTCVSSFRCYSTTPSQAEAPVQSGHRNGGPTGTRTQDKGLKRPLLYQLSYRPTENVFQRDGDI